MRKIVGYISETVNKMLSLGINPNTPIYLSDNNIVHIRECHSDAYIKYFDDLEEIIRDPDYIGIAGVSIESIEYVKRYEINEEYVNVAVRASKGGTYYIRTMFIIEDGRLNDYIKKGKLLKIQKPCT